MLVAPIYSKAVVAAIVLLLLPLDVLARSPGEGAGTALGIALFAFITGIAAATR